MKTKYRIKEVIFNDDSKEYYIEYQSKILWFKYWEGVRDIAFYSIKKDKQYFMSQSFDSFIEAQEILEEFLEEQETSLIKTINYTEL